MIFNSFADLKSEPKMSFPQKRESAENNISKQLGVGGDGDGSSIEVAKRPRGRPPGSKNKPKPPIIITRDADPSAAMRPHVLEIPSGRDVIESLAEFSRRKNLGICVLASSGAVADVQIRQPTPHPAGGTVRFHGTFEVLSMSATFLPPPAEVAVPGVSVAMAGPQGQIVGGTVVGPLVAAGTVTVVAAAFENPTYHRLPVEDDVSVSVSVSVSGEGAENVGDQEQVEQQRYGHREYPHHHHQAATAAAESCGMAIYSSHFPTEGIWAPMARPPHPPPY